MFADDIMTYRDKSWCTGTINHHSLLPPSERTFGSRSHNTFIYKSSIHCPSSRFFCLISFWWVHIRLVMTGCSRIFMFFFSFWVHGVSFGFHALEIPLLPFIIVSQIWMVNQEYFKASLRKVFFCSWDEHVLSFYGCYHGFIFSSSSIDHKISSLLIVKNQRPEYKISQ